MASTRSSVIVRCSLHSRNIEYMVPNFSSGISRSPQQNAKGVSRPLVSLDTWGSGSASQDHAGFESAIIFFRPTRNGKVFDEEILYCNPLARFSGHIVCVW